MLTGVRVFSSDSCWRQIVAELGATVVDTVDFADVDMDKLDINAPISPMELKSLILSEMDNTKILNSIFGGRVSLSELQAQIIVRLYKSGGMSADDLKVALGYAPNAKTHTVDTAIYGLRKLYGHDFIKNENGIFSIGKL